MTEVYQIHVSLAYSKPKIWRRLLITSDTKLSDLHLIIRISAGWTDYHMHQFIKDYKLYASNDPICPDGCIDYENITVKDLLKEEKDKMIYLYDFGDNWEHIVLLEKILPFDNNTFYPVCIKGKKNFPPDNCGGICCFYRLLEAIKDPTNPESAEWFELLERVGDRNYDPDHFDMNKINAKLKKYLAPGIPHYSEFQAHSLLSFL